MNYKIDFQFISLVQKLKMGITDFGTITKKYPDVVQTVKLSNLSGLRLAIDTAIYIHQFIHIGDENSYYWMFFEMFYVLKKNNIDPYFVFDGYNKPKEKEKEQQARKTSVESVRTKIKEAKFLADELINISSTDDVSDEIFTRIQEIIAKRKEKLEISRQTKIDVIKNYLDKVIVSWSKQVVEVTKQHIDDLKKLISLFGFNYVYSDSEGEKTAVFLCKKKICDAVLSEDSDLFAYNTKIIVRNLNIGKQEVDVVLSQNLRRKLGLSKKSFLDFTILLGNDYNNRIPELKIGVVKVQKLFEQYKSIEEIITVGVFTEEQAEQFLKYKRCRELFMNFEGEKLTIGNSVRPDFDGISKFIMIKFLNVNIDKIKSLWNEKEVRFEII